MGKGFGVTTISKRALKGKFFPYNVDHIAQPPSATGIPVGSAFVVQGTAGATTSQVSATLQGANFPVTLNFPLTQNAWWDSALITLSQASTTYTFTVTYTHNDGTPATQETHTYQTAARLTVGKPKGGGIAFPPSGLFFPGAQFNVVGFAGAETTRIEAYLLYKGLFGQKRCKRVPVTIANQGQPNATWQTPVLTFSLARTIYTFVAIFHHGAGALASSDSRVYQTTAPLGARRRRPSKKG